jgi:hypothetical protein
MNTQRKHARRRSAPQFLAPYPPKVTLSAAWRESAAIAAGFVVLLITAWLIWAALAEAAMALVEAG